MYTGMVPGAKGNPGTKGGNTNMLRTRLVLLTMALGRAFICHADIAINFNGLPDGYTLANYDGLTWQNTEVVSDLSGYDYAVPTTGGALTQPVEFSAPPGQTFTLVSIMLGGPEVDDDGPEGGYDYVTVYGLDASGNQLGFDRVDMIRTRLGVFFISPTPPI